MAGNESLVFERLWGQVKLQVHRFAGKNGDFLKASISRIYVDETTGKWSSTSFFSAKDLEGVALAAAEANNYILQNPIAETKAAA